MSTWRLAALGLVTHSMLLYSVLEVYYSSPLTHGMRQYGTSEAPPARRLVLFVADGLRADTLFQCRPDGSSAAPFIRNMSNLGTWGTAEAHVPTETRPGHVALIAGIYEDVSAITRGWQENPVDFDSVFNQSRYTWSWGSPDVLHMFSKGASGQHVFTVAYDSEELEFHKEGWPLDIWVLDRFKGFIKAASTNSTLNRMLREDRIVLFLHLLGIDTTGHAFKPASKQYEANLERVDQGVQEVCQLLDRFYGGDQRTAYVFTSDHGMTDWGSHGAGSAQETCIPLVAWGAGIRRGAGQALQCWPSVGSPTVEQVSFLRSMATVCINIPANSVGTLPLAYLNVSGRQEALLMVANFRQLLEQVQLQRDSKRRSYWRIFFRDFPKLTSQKVKSLLTTIESLLHQKRYAAVVTVCQQWVPVAKEAMVYYHQYERRFLTCCIVACFAAWILCVCSFMTDRMSPDFRLARLSRVEMAIWGSITLVLWCNSTPRSFFVYALMPLYLGHVANLSVPKFASMLWRRFPCWQKSLAGVVFFEMLILAFFYRYALVVCLTIIAAWLLSMRNYSRMVQINWCLLCLVNGFFLAMPVVGQHPTYGLVLFCCLAMTIVVAGLYARSGKRLWLLLALMQAAVGVAIWHIRGLSTLQRAIPGWVKFMCWLVLIASFILPLLSGTKLSDRLLAIALFPFLPFTLMSVSYEPLFYLFYTAQLYLWMLIEVRLPLQSVCSWHLGQNMVNKNTSASVSQEDIRRSLFFVFFLLLGFFGTGNIASINSFDPNFVMLFVGVFRPFLMGALLVLKMAIPVLIACSALTTIGTLKGANLDVTFWMVVVVSDLKALHFLFMLKDEGSWLEIGESVSHYVISMTMTAVVVVLCRLARWYMQHELMMVKKTLP